MDLWLTNQFKNVETDIVILGAATSVHRWYSSEEKKW
jgi:hypothetical protein